MSNVGYATLQVIPSMRGTAAALSGESNAVGTQAATAFSGGFNRVLSGGLIAAGVVAATGAALVAIGTQFDDAYDTIQTGTGATGDALEGLKDVFRDVVADVPTDFGSAADAITLLNQRLEVTGRPLEQLAEQFLNLSNITGEDLSRNVDSVTRAFGDWSVATEDQSEVLDRFFRASQDSGVAVSELAEGVVQFGSPLRQLGFSLDESIALFASFGEAGVNTSTVMGGLRLAVRNFASGLAEEELGVANFTDVLNGVRDGTFDLTDAMVLFGARAGTDMFRAIQEGRFDLEAFLETMRDTEGGIMDTAESTRDFGESFQILKNNVLLLLEGPATRLMDWLSGVAEAMAEFASTVREEGLGEALAEIREGFERLSTPMQTFVSAVAGLAVGAGILVGLKALGIAVTALANPFLLAAIGVFALVSLISSWDELSTPMQVFTVALGVVTAALVAYTIAVTAAKAATAFTALVGAFSAAAPVFTAIGGAITAIGVALGFTGAAAFAAGAAVVGAAAVFVASAIYIATHWSETVEFLRSAWMGLQNLAHNAFSAVAGTIGSAWSTIQSTTTSAWQAITGTVRTAWENIKNAVQSGINATVSFLATLPGRAVSAVASMVSGLTNKGREAMQGMFNAIRDVWGNISGWLGGLPGRIVSAVGSLARVLYDAGAGAIRGLWDGMQSVADGMIGWAQGLADTIGGILSGLNPFESASLDVTTTTAGPALSAFPVEAVSSRYSGQQTQTRVVVEANGVDSALVEWLRRSVRVESGGNVQAFLGA